MTARADPFPPDDELSEEEVAKTRRLLRLTADSSRNDSADSSTCSHPRKRKRPDSGLVMPKVPELALDADRHWSGRIHGLHPTGHLLGFRGLYVIAFRTTSRSVHSALSGLGRYVTDKPNRRVVNVVHDEGRLMWALIG
jgi:hypothetical protein